MARNIWDYSDILMSNRVGANIGAGITQAAGALSEGMVRGKQAKEERKQYTTVLETMDPDGAKSGKYAEASLGELRGSLDTMAAQRVKQRDAREAEAFKAQQELTAARKRQLDVDTAAAAREYQALSAARGGGGTPDPFPGIPRNFTAAASAVSRGSAPPAAGGSRASSYLDSGGSNPAMLQALRSLEASKPGFQLMTDPVSGARLGLDGNGNASVISKPEEKKAPPSSTKIDLGGGNWVYHLPGDKYLDKDMKPIMWSPEKPSLLDELGVKSPDPKAASGPAEVKTQDEFEKLPKGTEFIFNGRKGVKK